MEFASGSDAMLRVQAIQNELDMFDRMKSLNALNTIHKITIHEAGYLRIAELEAERAEIIGKYTN